ncbi:hypothetical protein V6N12_029478 [Hibiscus sabdariffa]|uniref:Secreted protein n=1 Tax=Hibiscus sabdariffa TaxID=183260 RepID=A0ABR2CW81_9ROSI
MKGSFTCAYLQVPDFTVLYLVMKAVPATCLGPSLTRWWLSFTCVQRVNELTIFEVMCGWDFANQNECSCPDVIDFSDLAA